jgi:hypothetical protein
MEQPLDLDAWIDNLEWTPETAGARVEVICRHLKNALPSTWLHFAPRIGASLGCLADNPDELYRLAVHVYNESPNASHKILAVILASVDATLPEHLAQEAVRTGAMGIMLTNKNYALSQRLSWLREHSDHVFPQKVKILRATDLEAPLKDALALWFFIAANKGEASMLSWMGVDLVEFEVSKREFLEMNAPSLLKHVDIVQVLGLSFADAFDMVMGAGCGEKASPMLELPDLGPRLHRS